MTVTADMMTTPISHDSDTRNDDSNTTYNDDSNIRNTNNSNDINDHDNDDTDENKTSGIKTDNNNKSEVTGDEDQM